MTLSEIERIGSDLDVAVPEQYKTYMQSYTGELFELACDFELLGSAEKVIELNNRLRSRPFYNGEAWPARCFAVGENGCGDYYYLDLQADPSPIYFVDHETMDFTELAPSLADWAPILLREKLAEQDT